MKRSVVTLSILLIFALVLAACSGGSNGNPAPASQSASVENPASSPVKSAEPSSPAEPVELKVMIVKDPVTGPFEEMKGFKDLEQEFNVKFTFIPVEREVVTERVNLAFTANELPDLIIGGLLTKQDILRFSQTGQIVPLNDLIEQHGPNIKKVNEQYPKMLPSQTAPDGKIYTLPYVDNGRHNQVKSRIFINSQWLQDLSLEMPKTLDDFHQVLTAFKEEKQAIPLSGLSAAGMYNVGTIVLTALGFPVVNDLNSLDSFFYQDNDQVKFVMTDPRYKEYLAYMNRLHAEGLLDPEYYTQNDAQHKAKGNEMKYGVFGYSGMHTLLTDPANQLQYTALPPLTSSSNNQQMWPVSDHNYNIAFAMTKANKHPELTMKIIDKGYEEEFAFSLRHPYAEIKDGVLQPDPLPKEFENNLWGYINALIMPVGAPYPYYYQTDKELKAAPPRTGVSKQFLDGLYMLFDNHGRVAYPNVFFAEEDLQTINLISIDILTYISQMEASFILGSEPIDNFDAYVEKIKSLGIDQLLEIYQKTYDNYKKSLQ